jgi:hypothetical protein
MEHGEDPNLSYGDVVLLLFLKFAFTPGLVECGAEMW